MKALFDQPEYLHLLVNPVLTHALPLAAVALLFGLAARSRAAMRLGLILVVISAAAVWPAVRYGDAGYDRMQSVADVTGGEWLDVHQHRARGNAWAFYGTALIGLAALLVPGRWRRTQMALGATALLAAIATSVLAAYIAFPAGRIRHRELRQTDPPAAELQAARKATPPPQQ